MNRTVTGPSLRHLWSLLVVAAGTALAAAPALAQDPPPPPPAPVTETGDPDGIIKFTTPKEGFTLLDLLNAVNAETDRSVLFDDTIQGKIQKAKINFVGTYAIPRSRLFDWLQGVLSFSSYILVPIGPENYEQWMVVDVTNQVIKSRPKYVDENDLHEWKDRDGVYIVTTLRVKNLDSQDAQRARTAIQQLATPTGGLGRVNEVPGQNAFIVADFAPVVWATKQLLDAMDVPLEANELVLDKVLIRHALASDLSDILTDLLQGSSVPGQPRPTRGQPGVVKPEPQIIADNRTNSLVLYAVPEDIAKIKTLIHDLDTPFTGNTRLHFRSLKYTEAEDVEELLNDLISGTSSSSSRAGTGRSGRGNNVNQPNATPFGKSVNENDPVIIADTKSNSLIINATRDQFADLETLIDKIDMPRKQVLIETALVELTVGDKLDLGIDAFSVADDVAVDTDGDGQPDTFTNARNFFGFSQFGNSLISSVDVNGTEVPVGNSPNLERSGLVAGIFDNGQIPVILRALQTRTPAKILTMPSIVTSDNQAATIATTDTVPFLITTFVGPNQTPQETFDSVSAETTLDISPSISADDFLRLSIRQVVSSFRAAEPGDRPPTTSRTIETELMVPNGNTVVLGGIVSSQETESTGGVPFLMDIPVLGFLFRNTSTSLSKTNLFLFVTPRIMTDLENFSDYHALTWEKKLLQDRLFGEEVEILGASFLGPNAPTSAGDAVNRIEQSGVLDAYRYKSDPSAAERTEEARRAWREMEQRRAGDGSEPADVEPADVEPAEDTSGR